MFYVCALNNWLRKFRFCASTYLQRDSGHEPEINIQELRFLPLKYAKDVLFWQFSRQYLKSKSGIN